MYEDFQTTTTKIGSNVLLDQNLTFNYSLVDEMAKTIKSKTSQNEKSKFVIVTSGGVGIGKKDLGLAKTLTLQQKQMAAARGSVLLPQKYDEVFSENGIKTNYIVVGADDLIIPERRKKFNALVQTSLKHGLVPIINENDSLQTDEIKFGDNDILGAIVANETQSDKYIILSNINGLYSDIKNKTVIPDVTCLTKASEYVKTDLSDLGTGGMPSKLLAAAAYHNQLVLANGNSPNILEKILSNEFIGTTFNLESQDKSSFLSNYVQNQPLGRDLKKYIQTLIQLSN